MDEAESARASEVLERLEALGCAAGLGEGDVRGGGDGPVHKALRVAVAKLAEAVLALPQAESGDADAASHARAAAARLLAVARGERGAADGELLDGALAALVAAVDEAPPAAADTNAPRRTELLEALAAHVQASRIVASRRAALEKATPAAAAAAAAAAAPPAEASQPPMDVDEPAPAGTTGSDDDAATVATRQLRAISRLLGAGGPPVPSAAPVLADVDTRLAPLLARLPPRFFEPLLPADVIDAATAAGGALAAPLADVYAALRSEYALRRRMLIERAQVTLQSFCWAPRLAETGQQARAAALAEAGAAALVEAPAVPPLPEALRARACDVAALVLRRAGGAATGSDGGGGAGVAHASVKGVRIGAVPDRGGRAEGRSKAAAMPEWAPRKEGGGGGGGGHRGGGGGGGGGRRGGKAQGGRGKKGGG